jgi:aspartate--ammonia ligase
MSHQRHFQRSHHIKDSFAATLCSLLNLQVVPAPLFVDPASGLNDDLNGVERPVSFDANGLAYPLQVVHSLAKWKRHALTLYKLAGVLTEMRAIRRDEITDATHSYLVQQWDIEMAIAESERSIDTLKRFASAIYRALRETALQAAELQMVTPAVLETLPADLLFVTSEELLERYPQLAPNERELAFGAEQKRAFFVSGIGHKLSDGRVHDLRAPDYDDWALNGDLFVYHPALGRALEISSMGVRVNAAALRTQLALANVADRASLPYHDAVLHDKLVFSIGGGIGIDRVLMYLLEQTHIKTVQHSVWPETKL